MSWISIKFNKIALHASINLKCQIIILVLTSIRNNSYNFIHFFENSILNWFFDQSIKILLHKNIWQWKFLLKVKLYWVLSQPTETVFKDHNLIL